MQGLTFTPSTEVCLRVSACAGPVELVEETQDRCVHADRSRIYRVRSLLTGDTCWAYLTELTIQVTEAQLEDAA